jgi:hypothetical protein
MKDRTMASVKSTALDMARFIEGVMTSIIDPSIANASVFIATLALATLGMAIVKVAGVPGSSILGRAIILLLLESRCARCLATHFYSACYCQRQPVRPC